jgi:hypothetical protein
VGFEASGFDARTPAEIFDPRWLPFSYSEKNRALTFAYVPRDVQQRVPFLDHRFIGQQPRVGPIPINALPHDVIASNARPIHFIFHTAFCCSSLLARALDAPGVSMGLKEPSVLLQLCHAATKPNAEVDAAITTTLDLLSRSAAGETNVVKPTHLVTPLAPDILRLRPNNKALVLHSSLDSFLRSTARKGLVGRTFARDTFFDLEPNMSLKSGVTPAERMRLTDLQIAAEAWLMQSALLQSMIQRFGRNRVRTLNGDVLVAEKSTVLPRVAKFFGLRGDDAYWEDVANGRVFELHGKDPRHAFNGDARRAQLDKMGEVHADEIKPVLQWAEKLAARCDVALDLGNTLLD